MAIDCSDPGAVANAARCFECYIPPGMQVGVETYLLAVIANAITGSSMDPQALLTASSAWSVAFGLEERLKAYLLCQIAAAGGANV